jgi:hypothetical protein
MNILRRYIFAVSFSLRHIYVTGSHCRLVGIMIRNYKVIKVGWSVVAGHSYKDWLRDLVQNLSGGTDTLRM